MTDEDGRVRYECKTCCYAVSGSGYSGTFWKKIDSHEEETGHVMDEVYE